MFTYKKIIIISACCFFTTIIFGFAAYQAIFEFLIKNQISLRQGNYVRQFYLKYPIALDFRVYFFNVTNPWEVHEGGTPILKEIGPYCYDLYKERIDVADNETEDSLTYSPHDTYIFNQERSGTLHPDDSVTILHPLIVGMINYVANTSPKLLPLLDRAIGFMFPQNENIFLTAKVRDILFDGMFINCSANDFVVSAVCSQIHKEVPGIVPVGKYDMKYSLLGPKNGTLPTRVKVLRGIKDSNDLGKLISVDNKTRSDVWNSEECNEYRGTDGWIFPPFSGNKKQIWIHPTDLCVNLHADYLEDGTSNGIKVRKFYADLEQECAECSGEGCAPKGMLDLTKCLKVPVYVSLPHFLNSDEGLLRQVQGLKPETEKHINRILLEGTLSLPMEAQIRIQFNFPIKSLEKIKLMQTIAEVTHPVLWIEMGVVINGWLLNLILAFLYTLTAIEVLKYLSLVLSLVGIGYGFHLYFKNRKVYTANTVIDLKPK